MLIQSLKYKLIHDLKVFILQFETEIFLESPLTTIPLIFIILALNKPKKCILSLNINQMRKHEHFA